MNTTVGNNRKLTEKGKVELLENIVLSGDVEKVNAVIEECQTFEFTARALGLACLYASLDVVKALIKAGATFYYPVYILQLLFPERYSHSSICETDWCICI